MAEEPKPKIFDIKDISGKIIGSIEERHEAESNPLVIVVVLLIIIGVAISAYDAAIHCGLLPGRPILFNAGFSPAGNGQSIRNDAPKRPEPQQDNQRLALAVGSKIMEGLKSSNPNIILSFDDVDTSAFATISIGPPFTETNGLICRSIEVVDGYKSLPQKYLVSEKGCLSNGQWNVVRLMQQPVPIR